MRHVESWRPALHKSFWPTTLCVRPHRHGRKDSVAHHRGINERETESEGGREGGRKAFTLGVVLSFLCCNFSLPLSPLQGTVRFTDPSWDHVSDEAKRYCCVFLLLNLLILFLSPHHHQLLFSHSIMTDMSLCLRSVVLGMLQVDPARRMSAADVLRDPWIRSAARLPDVCVGKSSKRVDIYPQIVLHNIFFMKGAYIYSFIPPHRLSQHDLPRLQHLH